MTFTRQDIDDNFYSGSSKDLTVTIWQDTQKTLVKDLTGAEITYSIVTDDDVILFTKSSTDSTQIEVPTPGNGVCIVHIKPGDTDLLHGTFTHHMSIVDANGYIGTVLTGQVRIFQSFAKRPRTDIVGAYLEGGS